MKQEEGLNGGKRIRALMDDARKLVDPVMFDILKTDVDPLFAELVRYQAAAGGKRLRPLFVILSCRAVGGRDPDAVAAAAGLEILHNYTLIVDDIIDHSDLRRGKPTLWAKYGSSMAECAGIHYAASVFRAANRSPRPQEITEIFARALTVIMNGEVLDILYEQSGREEEAFVVRHRVDRVTPARYRAMASRKTANLFSASCRAGAMCGNATNERVAALEAFGRHVGVVFQIRDDVLDIFGDRQTFGKVIGKDIMEKKAGNIVVAIALEELSRRKQLRLERILKTPGPVEQPRVLEAVEMIEGTHAKARAEARARRHLLEAARALDGIPHSNTRDDLRLLADFVVNRSA